jgi:hypothetical protein
VSKNIFGISKTVQPTIKAAGASLGYDPFTKTLPMKRPPNSSKQPRVSKKTYAGTK